MWDTARLGVSHEAPGRAQARSLTSTVRGSRRLSLAISHIPGIPVCSLCCQCGTASFIPCRHYMHTGCDASLRH